MNKKIANLGKIEFIALLDNFDEGYYCEESRHIIGQRTDNGEIFFLYIGYPYCTDSFYLRFYKLDELIRGRNAVKTFHKIKSFLKAGDEREDFKCLKLEYYWGPDEEEYAALSEDEKKALREKEHEEYDIDNKIISYSIDEILDKVLEVFCDVVEWVPTKKSRSGKTLYESYPDNGHKLPQVDRAIRKLPSQATKDLVKDLEKYYDKKYYDYGIDYAYRFIYELRRVMIWIYNHKEEFPAEELVPLMELLMRYEKLQGKVEEALHDCQSIIEDR